MLVCHHRFIKGNVLNFITENWMLFALALVSGSMLLIPIFQGALQPGLTPSLVVQLMNKERAVVVDVRTLAEHQAERIAGAVHIELSELEAKLPQVHKNKAQALVLVCESGMRSIKGMQVAKKLGYEQAHSLSGGMKAWKEATLPTQTQS
jgi:rhodanese-related sulfurtransferase